MSWPRLKVHDTPGEVCVVRTYQNIVVVVLVEAVLPWFTRSISDSNWGVLFWRMMVGHR